MTTTAKPLNTPEQLAPPRYRRTKIVATIGPASNTLERVKQLILAGANVFRLNFSHGSHEAHLASLNVIRQASDELGIPAAVLQDLSGPKIRISEVEGDYAHIADDATIALAPACGKKSNTTTIYVETLNPIEILKPGETVLLADGIITLHAEEVRKDSVICRITKGGRIRSRVGIAFPDSNVSLPATTEKDLKDLDWGIEHKVDFVAISFVQNDQDILMLRKVIESKGGSIPIIAKIERRSALDNIEAILECTDGLMVARGDLGLELPLERVPRIQLELIEGANSRGIPVIVATQMLHSMITSLRPTRAEVSDIATAVMSGADAVMLSEETAIGEHPAECVRVLDRVAFEAEQTFQFDEFKFRLKHHDRAVVPEAVAYAACAAAVKINAQAIIACTETGTSARLVAKYRPQQPLYGLSGRPATLRRMCLYWGVVPIAGEAGNSHAEEVELALRTVQHRQNAPGGARAVITGGPVVKTPGSSSILEVHKFPLE